MLVCSWKNARMLTLAGAQEYTAQASHVCQWANQMSLGQVLLRFTAPSVKTFTIPGQSTRAVSFPNVI
jgi:hypothetical protein